MISNVKCFDVVNMVVQDASDEFGEKWSINHEALKTIERRCDKIESIMKDFNGDMFEASVDEYTHDITLSFAISHFIPKTQTDYRMMILLLSSDEMKVSGWGRELIRFDIIVPGVWDYE